MGSLVNISEFFDTVPRQLVLGHRDDVDEEIKEIELIAEMFNKLRSNHKNPKEVLITIRKTYISAGQYRQRDKTLVKYN